MEQAISLNIVKSQSLAILHSPRNCLDTAVLIVVGGPQYRVGSHRQFIQLSRHLAKNNIASLRFDYRGMGDANAEKQKFSDINKDIKAAIDCLFTHQPNIMRVVIWGLCDAASAALIYAHKDSRVSGLVLLNPWFRNEKSMGKTMIKFYYLQRLLSKGFWKKLILGRIDFAKSATDAKGFVKNSLVNEISDDEFFQERMVHGITYFKGNICLILSGLDITAREFDEQTRGNKKWQKLTQDENEIHYLKKADHTFSNQTNKQQVETITTEFINQLSKNSSS